MDGTSFLDLFRLSFTWQLLNYRSHFCPPLLLPSDDLPKFSTSLTSFSKKIRGIKNWKVALEGGIFPAFSKKKSREKEVETKFPLLDAAV